jgi:hypothetical protein
MSKAKLQSVIENAISKADSSYFFEDYSKQARAVMQALQSAGFMVLPKDVPNEIYVQVSNEMRTGRVKPEEHIRDVYQTILRIVAVR